MAHSAFSCHGYCKQGADEQQCGWWDPCRYGGCFSWQLLVPILDRAVHRGIILRRYSRRPDPWTEEHSVPYMDGIHIPQSRNRHRRRALQHLAQRYKHMAAGTENEIGVIIYDNDAYIETITTVTILGFIAKKV